MISIAIFPLLVLIKAIQSIQYDLNLRETATSFTGELKVKKSLWFIPIKIGYPQQQTFEVFYDTSAFHLWVGNVTLRNICPKVHDKTKSETYEETTNEIVTTNQLGNEALDYVYIGDMDKSTPNKKLSFVILNQLINPSLYEGVLGMARNFPGKIKYSNKKWIEANPRFSLIDYLYLSNQIHQKVFAHRFTAKDKATLYIGETGTKKKAYPSCSIDPEFANSRLYHLWHCKSNGLYTTKGEVISDQNATAIFDSSRDNILFPLDIGEKLFAYINDITEGKYCTKRTLKKGTVLYCSQNFPLGSLSDIHLNLGDFNVILKLQDMFNIVYEEGDAENMYGYEAKFVVNNHMNYILLGTSFMKYYHLIFDMDKESVTFGDYIDIFLDNEAKDLLKLSHKWSFSTIAWIISVSVVVLIVSVLMFQKRSKNKKRLMQGLIKDYSKEQEIEPVGQVMVNAN